MGIRLIAIDLDGTLLTTAKQIGEPTVAALAEAARRGLHVVLATARPPRSVLPFYRRLGLDTPTINYNGALVHHPPSRRVLLHRPIPARIALQATRLARGVFPRVLVSAEILDRWYTDRVDIAYRTETAHSHGPDVVAPIATWLNQPITKLLMLGKPAELRPVAVAVRRRMARELTIGQTEDFMLQIMNSAASKARALQTVAAELGVERRQVMAIGDNANDVPMLRWAHVGVAMGNADETTRAAADRVTDDNDSDGVANAIRTIALGGSPAGG